MKETPEHIFQAHWEEILLDCQLEDVDKYLLHCSPLHPNSNMRWLYDRLISKKAEIYA